jgi:hypothetical protein
MRAVVACSLLTGCTTLLAPEAADHEALRLAIPTVAAAPIPASGGPVLLTVDGLDPAETVWLVAGSRTGSGPCFGALGGECLGVRNPTRLGSAVADAAGHAELTATFPALPVGRDVAIQAAVPRGVGGVDSVLSAVLLTEVGAVDLDADGFDSAVDCDDADPDVNPGALERCDGVDTDCDPATAEDGLVTVGVTNYGTISDAVYFAPPGAEISVCAGTYAEAIEIERPVTLIGVAGAEDTVIDATGTGHPTLDLVGAGEYLVEGVTVTGGDSGVRLGQSVELTLRHAVVTGNHAVRDEGGGISDDSYYWSPSSVWLEDVEISYNSAEWEGGGMYLASGVNTLVDVRFLYNDGGSGGGAIFVNSNAGTTTITDCVFHGNTAPGTGLDGGGAILINVNADNVVVTDSDFGVGATENLLDDVTIYRSSGPVSYTWFQDHETFTCSTGTYSCL